MYVRHPRALLNQLHTNVCNTHARQHLYRCDIGIEQFTLCHLSRLRELDRANHQLQRRRDQPKWWMPTKTDKQRKARQGGLGSGDYANWRWRLASEQREARLIVQSGWAKTDRLHLHCLLFVAILHQIESLCPCKCTHLVSKSYAWAQARPHPGPACH